MVAIKTSFLLILACILAACGTGTPRPSALFENGQALYTIDLTQPQAWAALSVPAHLAVDRLPAEGVIRLRSTTERYGWALHTDTHTDALLEVHTRLNTNTPNNGYGVGCRMSANGAGYYFLISRDGYHAILLATAQALTPLTEWRLSDAIRTGAGAQNRVRAVCVGDVLQLYVNEVFLAEARNSQHTTGASALVAAGSNLGASNIDFTDIAAWQPARP